MRNQILILLFILVGRANADYDLLLFDKKIHYSTGKYFYSWQTTKSKINADSSVFMNYFSPEIISGTEDVPTCVIDTGDGHWGRRAVILKSGICYFINSENKPIIFNTKAQKNDKWTLYQINDFNKIEATLSDVIYDRIEQLGVYDSIKIINLEVLDRAGNRMVNKWNDSAIHLSKNYGIIKGYGMLSFPNKIIPLNLSGIESTDTLGVIPISFKDVFNYKIGDEFHIFEGDTGWGNQGILTWRRMLVIDKYDIPNTNIVNYEIEDRVMQVIYNQEFKDTSYSFNIVQHQINLEKYINQLPEQSYKYMFRNYIDSILVSNRIYINDFLGRQVIRTQQSYERYVGDCYIKLTNTGGLIHYTYIEGCGDFFEQDWNYSQQWKRLIYVKKGDEEWGKPLDFVLSAQETVSAGNLYLMSNALRYGEKVSIYSAVNQDVIVSQYDLLGKLIYSAVTYLDEGINRVPIASQGAGVYFLELKAGTNGFRKRVLIVP